MSSTVTVEQLKNLWTNGGRLERGDDFPPVTQDVLGALASGLDLDDDGMPVDDGQWEVLADQLNSETPGETDGSWAQEDAIETIDGLRRDRDRAQADFVAAIRAAVSARVPVATVARAAGLSRERVYQIRDGRR